MTYHTLPDECILTDDLVVTPGSHVRHLDLDATKTERKVLGDGCRCTADQHGSSEMNKSHIPESETAPVSARKRAVLTIAPQVGGETPVVFQVTLWMEPMDQTVPRCG